MTNPAPAAPPTAFFPAACYWLKRSPLAVMAVYCAISLILEENYPFSHYPMYSNPGADRSYYILADGDGKPLPVVEVTGGSLTCPKIGKMFRSKARKAAEKLKISPANLTAEQTQAVGLDILQQIRHYAQSKGRPLPARLQLQRVDIGLSDDGRVTETPELLSTE